MRSNKEPEEQEVPSQGGYETFSTALVDDIHEFRDESTNWSRSESKEVVSPDLFILFTHGSIRVRVQTRHRDLSLWNSRWTSRENGD